MMKSLSLRLVGGLAVVNFSQPERGNPFDDDFARDFKLMVNVLRDCSTLRAVLVRAGPC